MDIAICFQWRLRHTLSKLVLSENTQACLLGPQSAPFIISTIPRGRHISYHRSTRARRLPTPPYLPSALSFCSPTLNSYANLSTPTAVGSLCCSTVRMGSNIDTHIMSYAPHGDDYLVMPWAG